MSNDRTLTRILILIFILRMIPIAGRIDHAHHNNNAWRALTDTHAMDDAVKRALEMVNLDETLIIVTADHGHVMTINGYPDRGIIVGKFTFFPILILLQNDCSIDCLRGSKGTVVMSASNVLEERRGNNIFQE